MIRDLDIYRSANVLIREHGEDAALEAAMRADAMLEKGGLEGQAVWKRIVRAVQEIQRTDRPSGRSAAITGFIGGEIALSGPSCYHHRQLGGAIRGNLG